MWWQPFHDSRLLRYGCSWAGRISAGRKGTKLCQCNASLQWSLFYYPGDKDKTISDGGKTKTKTKPHKQTKPLKHQTTNKVSSSPNSATSSKQKYSATSYSEWCGVPVSAVQLRSRNNAVLWRLGSSFISVFLSPTCSLRLQFLCDLKLL